MLDPRDLPLLQTILRTRDPDPVKLARTLGERLDAVAAGLERLAAAGFLIEADSERIIVSPTRPMLSAAAAALLVQAETAAAVGRALGALPGLERDWEIGAPAELQGVPMEMLHGEAAIVDAWWRYVDRNRPVDAFGSFEARAFLGVAPEAARLGAALGRPGGRIRIVVGEDALDAEALDAIGAMRAVGVEFRSLPRGASWFIGDGEEDCGFPTQWGDHWPRSVRLLRDPVATAALRTLFDELWRRAAPVRADAAPWEPILPLLDAGLTDAEIAVRLHLSERTVRRRVAAAMTEFGVEGRFALGRAWGRGRG